MPDYTVRDKESGKVITFRWNGDQPPTDADLNEVFNQARHTAPTSEQPPANPQPMLRSRTGALYQPPAESGLGDFVRGAGEAVNPLGWLDSAVSAAQDPMGALGSLATSPIRFLGDLVNNPAHALGTVTGSVGAGAALGALPIKRLAKAGVAGAAAGAEKLPVVGAPTKAAIEAARESWAGSGPATADPGLSPRLAGKAPTLQESIASALDQVRQGEPPAKVSLPGGNTYRADGAVPSAPPRAPAAAPAAPPGTAPGTPATAPAASAPLGPKAAAVAAKLNLTAQEYTAFQDLLQQGYPMDRVLQAIQGQRAAASLSSRFGLPSDAEVQSAVADRNTRGRWPQDRR